MQFTRRLRSRKASIALSCVLISLFVASAQANTFFQLGLSAGYEDNVARGQSSAQEMGSGFARLEYSVGKLYELGLKNIFVLSAELNATNYKDLSGFVVA
jgi:hypothetical protein